MSTLELVVSNDGPTLSLARELGFHNAAGLQIALRVCAACFSEPSITFFRGVYSVECECGKTITAESERLVVSGWNRTEADLASNGGNDERS